MPTSRRPDCPCRARDRAAARGLSDRALAWRFILPSPPAARDQHLSADLDDLLSFTDYRANQPGREIKWIGLRNYERLLNSEDIWGYLQVTAHFVCWSIFFQVCWAWASRC